MVLKKISVISVSLVWLLLPGYAFSSDNYCKIANAVFVGLLPSIDKANPEYKFGRLVCEAGGGNALSCSSSMSIGAGICQAGGGNALSCSSSMSLGAGICHAGGGNALSCSNSMSVGAGLCHIGGNAIKLGTRQPHL